MSRSPDEARGGASFRNTMGKNAARIYLSGASAALLAATLTSGAAAQEPVPAAQSQAPAAAAPAETGQFVVAAGPGADTFQRVCGLCHTPERIVSNRKTRTEWEETIDKMITRGAQVSDDNYGTIEEYLLQNYGRVNVNRGTKDDLMAVAGLTAEEADILMKARTEKGPLADFAALIQVPGLDAKKLETKKDALTF
jgi:cytochrome c5